jgi:hypothetical protein
MFFVFVFWSAAKTVNAHEGQIPPLNAYPDIVLSFVNTFQKQNAVVSLRYRIQGLAYARKRT